ncbi:MAG: hypothetical protein LBF59_08945, partial [Prevotellaceae bacterium]|nr:hypothetical protein [Prevotellaceae bacterium]
METHGDAIYCVSTNSTPSATTALSDVETQYIASLCLFNSTDELFNSIDVLFHSIDSPEARQGFNMNNPEQAAGAARGIVASSLELRSSSTLTVLTGLLERVGDKKTKKDCPKKTDFVN